MATDPQDENRNSPSSDAKGDRTIQQLEPRSHRPCSRISAEDWNNHKDAIRRLLLDQDKTYKEVVTVLHQNHGLTVGCVFPWIILQSWLQFLVVLTSPLLLAPFLESGN